MCLIFIGHRAHPRFPLVVVANRDEYHSRATGAATWWPSEGESRERTVFAGRDLVAGGTWMGVTRNGRFAAITNYRGTPVKDPNPPSRGGLVTDFLTRDASADDYVHELLPEGHRYNGFSVLAYDGADLYCYSNRAEEVTRATEGMHGLSNHLFDSPWPKVTRGLAAMRRIMAGDDDADALLHACFDVLSDHDVPADGELPDTGVGLDRERALAPMFVHGDLYGTRSSTVLLLDEGGTMHFEERSFDDEAREVGRVEESWRIG